MSEEPTESESETESTTGALPVASGGGVAAACLFVALLVTLPLHLAALRGEGSVPTALIAFSVALAVLWILSAVLTWLVGAIDGEPAPAPRGHDDEDPDHRIVPC